MAATSGSGEIEAGIAPCRESEGHGSPKGKGLNSPHSRGVDTGVAGAIFFGLVLILGGCSGSDKGTDPGPDGPPYDDGRLTYPLSVGDEWIYQAEDPDTGELIEKSGFSTRVVGTHMIDGETYASVVDTAEELSDTTYVRQSGGQVLLYPAAFLRPALDPLTQWVQEYVGSTLPWRIIDFGAATDESWLIGEAEGQVDLGAIMASVAGSVHVEALGTAPVSSPAGDFETAYLFKVTLDADIETTAPVPSRVTSEQTLFVVDDIGVVREEAVEETVFLGKLLTERTIRVLTSFDVAAP